jgi:Spy/CpxP family protein refolding chaperone
MSVNRRRVINWVLVVSLSLNLLVFGGIAARILIDPNGRPLPQNLSWILDDLDEATLQRLEPHMEEYRAAMRPLRGEIFRAQVDVNELLTEEPLNEEALKVAFDELREVATRYLEITQQQTIEIFAQITPEQRIHAMSFMQDRRDPDERRGPENDSDR